MRAADVRPTGIERTFDKDRLIVTKTDTKGLICYANPLFLEVSAYTEDQVIGQPHNIIRHPDMPRCVFQLLWDRIGAGHELFAYVLNLAGDGAHYWVLAHVTPSIDSSGRKAGYHSNRRVPEPAAVRTVEQLYARLRAEERRHPRPADALAASTELLNRTLADAGQTYDQYVWALARQSVGAGR